MKYIALFIVCSLFISATAVSQPQKLYFEPSTASGIAASAIFEEINYIPLETKRASLFGRISQLIVTDQYFVIYDTDTKAIYFFFKDGKFDKKFKFRRYHIRYIFYDAAKDALLISGINKNYSPSKKDIQAMIDDPVNNNSIKYTRAIYYYLSGDKKGHTEVVKDFDIALANPYALGDGKWVYSYIYANPSWPNTEDYELKISDGHRIIKSYFPYNRKTSSVYYGKPDNISFYKSGNDNNLLFTRPFHYDIYRLTPDTITSLYTVVLPAQNTIPNTFFDENFSSRSSLEDFKVKNLGLAWGIDNVIDQDRYLFFSLDFFRNFRGRNFIFDKKTTMFYNQNRLRSDSANNYLPVLGWTIQASDKDHIYTSVSSASMFQNKSSNEKRDPKYGPVLEKYFSEGSREDNPVIIELKPKAK